MYGAVGYPNKVSKTIIVGKRADLVCRLLYILTYFIRCGEVHENLEKREQVVMEYKEAALKCGYDFIQATESGYHSDAAMTDNEEHQATDTPQHHLESSLETVEETSESLASPVESASFVLDRKKLTLSGVPTLADQESRTELPTPEDGEITPVATTWQPLIKCKDDNIRQEVQCEFVAPVGSAASPQQHAMNNLATERQDVNVPAQSCDQSCDAKGIVLRCKEDTVFERKCETQIPVGHASTMSGDIDSEQPFIKCKDPLDTILHAKCESEALVGHANVIRCKDDTVLEAKKETVAHVGRSSNIVDETISATVKSDDNENQLTKDSSMDYPNSLIDSRFHVCEAKTDRKTCNSQGLKLATKQCNSTQNDFSRNPETGGQKSPGSKEAHDLYCHDNMKSGIGVLNQTEKASFMRSLSSTSSTSSVFSSDLDSGLWMGVNKGSEVIADTQTSAELYNRAISTQSTTSTHSYDTDGTLTPDHEELPLAL